MNSIEINKLFKNYKCYVGTYARNMLPTAFIKQRPFALIMNTDPIEKPGQHWVAVFVDTKNNAEYFDSYGFQPLHQDVYNFFENQKINNLLYNTKQFQGVTATTCGQYCVTFLKLRCQNISFNEIVLLDFNDTNIKKVI
jgi:hypothetical protein